MSDPSKESDIYSLTMTSFSVCSYAINYLAIRYNHLTTTRFSRGYYHMMTMTAGRSPTALALVSDRPVQPTKIRFGGCRTPSGM